MRGAGSLFPRDAVLYLPACRYSWPLQRLAVMSCRSGSYEQARGFVQAATGVSIGKRQLEQVTIAASGDTGAYRDWHITQEHQRNHLSRYQDGLDLAA